MKTFSAAPSEERGIALVELSILIVPLIFIVLTGFECTSYMRQRQVAQMLSRETAVSVYKKCSGFELPVAGAVDAGRAAECLAEAENGMRDIHGAAGGASFLIGIYRCDPPNPTTACTTPKLIASRVASGAAPVSITEFNTSAAAAGPFRSLLLSQRAVVAVRVSFPYQSTAGGRIWNRLLSVFNMGVVSDVTIL